jgi:hypothetical protein
VVEIIQHSGQQVRKAVVAYKNVNEKVDRLSNVHLTFS